MKHPSVDAIKKRMGIMLDSHTAKQQINQNGERKSQDLFIYSMSQFH